MYEDQQTYQRAVGASVLGLALQLILAVVLFVLGLWSGTLGVKAAAWYAAGGLGLWVVQWLVFQQHKLERIETLEAEQLAGESGGSSIFEVTEDDLAVARKRLDWLYKWVVTGVSVVTGLYLIAIGFWLAGDGVGRLGAEGQAAPGNVLAAMAICAGLGIVTFLVSRYLAGMAKVDAWQLLRGGAGYLMGNVGAILGLLLGLVLARFEYGGLLRFMAVLIPLFMTVVGIEILLNLLFGFYRPRKKGERGRAAFDSRLLGLFTSPESIARTISEAINFQFGFEITKNWFWQLLARAFGWLVIFGIASLVVISSLVVVEPHQRAVVETFGRLGDEVLKPGLHVKLPWPISGVKRYDVTRVGSVDIGSKARVKEDVKAILWTNEHAEVKPVQLLVRLDPVEDADGVKREDKDGADERGGLRGIALVNAEIDLQYRVDAEKLLDYVQSHAEPKERLRVIGEREVLRVLPTRTIDQWLGGTEAGDDGLSVQAKAALMLRDRIQKRADEEKLGLKVLTVSFVALHPPTQAAEAFHEKINAEQSRNTERERAEREAIQIIGEVAGSRRDAAGIEKEIRAYNKLLGANAEIAEVLAQRAKVEGMLSRAGGEAIAMIHQAQAERSEGANKARADALIFGAQQAGYEGGKGVYQARAEWQAIKELSDILLTQRKYIIAFKHDGLLLRGDFTTTRFGTIESAFMNEGDN